MPGPQFENYFPAGCPEAVCVPVDCEAFRIVKVRPLRERDFQTQRELGKPSKTPCGGCGLSVLDTLENAVHAQRAMRGLGDFIAVGKLAAAMGVRSKPNKHGHFNVWCFKGVTSNHRVAVFRSVGDDAVALVSGEEN